ARRLDPKPSAPPPGYAGGRSRRARRYPPSKEDVSMTMRRRKFLRTAAAAATAASVGPWVARYGKAADEIKVAELHDLSGVIDIFGISCNEAFNLAVEE